MKKVKKLKTVTIDSTIYAVETLEEWLGWRIKSIQNSLENPEGCSEFHNLQGRLVELLIIWDKIHDGRIVRIE